MKQHTTLIFTLTIFLALSLISCSQKFPKPSSDETGVLVIAHEAVNETEHNFAYKYILKSLPEIDVEIRIMPSTTSDFIMINNFPVGTFWISGVTTMPVNSGTSIPLTIGGERTINGDSFEIKPNQVTLLSSRFEVLKKTLSDSRSRQSWKFKILDENTKKELINSLKKLENSELWNFSF